MQTESERDKELRLVRREYLRKLDEKLNKAEPKKETKKRKAIIEPAEKEEVVSVNESSNEDALFSEEE